MTFLILSGMAAPLDRLLQIDDPGDYFTGAGHSVQFLPRNILLFVRRARRMLQQEALQNRSHHRHVLAFNLATDGCVHVDQLALSFARGQALLILPYQFHHFSRLASDDLRWLFCTFEMPDDAVLGPLRNRVIDVSGETGDAMRLLLEEWQCCSTPAGAGEIRESLLQTALLRLLLLLRQDLRTRAPDSLPEHGESLVRKVNRFMSKSRGRPVLVADVADALGLSTSRLRARFKEVAGIPIGSYLRNYRINRAMSLLRTTELRVSEIADETGFGSPQAFSRVFRQKTGDSPREYRRRT